MVDIERGLPRATDDDLALLQEISQRLHGEALELGADGPDRADIVDAHRRLAAPHGDGGGGADLAIAEDADVAALDDGAKLLSKNALQAEGHGVADEGVFDVLQGAPSDREDREGVRSRPLITP